MIPGVNLLSVALGVIQPQGVQLARFTGRATNAAGNDVATYAAPVGVQGSVQPIPKHLYQTLGLDFAKTYVTLYTVAGVVAVDRDGAGDRFTYDGFTYVCESLTDWKAQDGWVAVVSVRVPA